ncbi:hypothetical protein M9H77_11947 [Catharanthus roseus]|uniref:Uncharacterized protein n=1 Tax=Catharanthus roseus TaxID=4058 RepID=A0ACC0BG38_CATRO|nr:hypothetical protein M9H77_11947 [Catharanthus roseus]
MWEYPQYQPNASLSSFSSCVQNFWIQNVENERSLGYNIFKIISFYPCILYLCFDHLLKGTKLCSLALVCDRKSLQNLCSLTLMRERNHAKEGEDLGENVGRELFLCHGDSSMSFSLNLFLSYIQFFFKDLNLFLNIFASREIIVGVLCPTFQTCDLCLVDFHLAKCLSFHISLGNKLLLIGAKLEQSFCEHKCGHDILDISSKVLFHLGHLCGACFSAFLNCFLEIFLLRKLKGICVLYLRVSLTSLGREVLKVVLL